MLLRIRNPLRKLVSQKATYVRSMAETTSKTCLNLQTFSIDKHNEPFVPTLNTMNSSDLILFLLPTFFVCLNKSHAEVLTFFFRLLQIGVEKY